MSSHHESGSFPINYLLVLAAMFPVWMGAGLLWGGLMMLFVGYHPFKALVLGTGVGAFMWLFAGNLFAVGFAWRRSVELPAPGRASVRAAIKLLCTKLRLVVLSEEEPDEVVLGPRWALVRFQLQEVLVTYSHGFVTLSAPALSFGAVRKELRRALDYDLTG
jgi:hypothetical protein